MKDLWTEDIKRKNKRAGTENVAEIVALGKAAQIAEKKHRTIPEKIKIFKRLLLRKNKKGNS